ncbi:hypothetical protein [Sphingopyxis sp.]|uniref:hypothetical protein n=1 Tax=Sphingopyxis sp. TaxID=1908224 RepID=UPI00260F1FCC|nr:hypothetical protein [Sphingopyxis sp.]MCW0196675.1 hypothetical protein [Sphingopyxis sp.]
MIDFRNEAELRALWRDDEVSFTPLALDDIKRRAARLSDVVRRRNRREYIGAALVLAVFGIYAVILPGWLLKAGSLMTMAAAMVVVRQLARRSSGPDPDAEAQDVRGHYRARLMREEHLLANVGRWYLAPFLPGLLLFLAGLAEARGVGNPLAFAMVLAFQILVFGGIWLLNRHAAARIRAHIERIDRAASFKGDIP